MRIEFPRTLHKLLSCRNCQTSKIVIHIGTSISRATEQSYKFKLEARYTASKTVSANIARTRNNAATQTRENVGAPIVHHFLAYFTTPRGKKPKAPRAKTVTKEIYV